MTEYPVRTTTTGHIEIAGEEYTPAEALEYVDRILEEVRD